MKQRHIIGLALLVALVIGALGATGGAGNQSVIGYVNPDRLTAEYPSMAAVNKLYQDEVTKLQAEFDEKSKGLSEQEMAKLFGEYQVKLQQREVELKINEKVQAAIVEINKAIEKVAQEKGMTLVIDSAAVVHGGTDLTEAVLAKGK